MIEILLFWLSQALVVLGLLIMTIAVYGIIRMPDLYTRLHAASKAVFVGGMLLLVAAGSTGNPAIIFRAILIGVFLVLTTTVSTHAICRAAYHRKEPMRSPGAIDESGRLATEILSCSPDPPAYPYP